MKTEKTGLFVGKFAPFHKGHQLVIETALKEMDKLIVMIYDCPETVNTPLSVRSKWIKKKYPEVEIIEAWDGPSSNGYTPEIKKEQEDYILKSLRGQAITHFYSSEPYGAHMSNALDAENRQVDLERLIIPISATKIREDTTLNKSYIDDVVYKNLITNVVFMGAPSSGKTTLARELAKEFQTNWMPEYGREYWDTHQIKRRLTLKQMVEIAEGHIIREDSRLLKSNKYLFTDTNAITTHLFSKYYHGESDVKLEKLARNCIKRYDLVFICDTDIPYDNTWDRSGEVNREIFHKQNLAYLKENKIPYILLNGNLRERINKVKKVLNEFEKYSNFFGNYIQRNLFGNEELINNVNSIQQNLGGLST